MVRYHWHVEDGHGAFIPPGSMAMHPCTHIQHALCEIQVPGQPGPCAEACFTVPMRHLNEGRVRDVGVILGHGDDAEEWQGPLLTQTAVALAQAGFLVMRYYCSHSEPRRVRLYEKALDVCATSPFARFVQRWVLAGHGSGARVAVVTGSRCRGTIAGFACLSYPLKEPMASSKGRASDSKGPLLTIQSQQRVLFISGDDDPVGHPSLLRTVAPKLHAQDVRLATVPNVNAAFSHPHGSGPTVPTLHAITSVLVNWVIAISNNDMRSCSAPLIRQPGDAVKGADADEELEDADDEQMEDS